LVVPGKKQQTPLGIDCFVDPSLHAAVSIHIRYHKHFFVTSSIDHLFPDWFQRVRDPVDVDEDQIGDHNRIDHQKAGQPFEANIDDSLGGWLLSSVCNPGKYPFRVYSLLENFKLGTRVIDSTADARFPATWPTALSNVTTWQHC